MSMKSSGGRVVKLSLRSRRPGRRARRNWTMFCTFNSHPCLSMTDSLTPCRKAVGGSTAIGTSNTNPEELVKELETFDMKVYKAQMQMVREMNAKLRSLGIPFFGTRSDLVRPVGKEPSETEENGGLEEKAMIDEIDLVKLQRKMLAILEDLCND
jgi:hypothetical protein